jgi:membrane associated rhomboid family serine protease
MIKPLIWANIIIYVIQQLAGPEFTYYLGLNTVFLKRLQIWRLGTYMFAHGGMGHIFFNMYGLYLFGRQLEERIGPHRFLNLYLGSGIVGGLVWSLFNWNMLTWVIGASGSVFGIMMATAMLFPNQQIMLLFPPIPMKLKTFAFGYAAIEFMLAIQQGGGRIAHVAHLGGALAGYLFIRHHYRSSSWSPFASLQAFLRRKHEQSARRQREQFRMHRDTPSSATPDSTNDVDKILDKIGREGIDSLTPAERKTLESARERLRRK